MGEGDNAMSDEIEDGSDRYRAPALDKGLDILEALADLEEGLSQAELAKVLDRKPNEIYRMLDRLVRRGYVARTSGDRYELTLKLFELAHRHSPTRRLVSLALPFMRRFVQAAEQACHISVYDRGALSVVAQVDAPGYWSFGLRIGARMSLVSTGSGHVALAFSSAEERQFMLKEREIMPREQWPEDFDAQLDKVQADGFIIMPSQQTSGVFNIAVPLLGPQQNVLAVLACPFLQRLDTDLPPSCEAVLEKLREMAAQLMLETGGVL